MKIYFTASARGADSYSKEYKLIFQTIEKLGHTNLDDIVLKGTKVDVFEHLKAIKESLYEKTLKKIKMADVIILDISINSLSMGFVLHQALELGKPVIAVHHKSKQPLFASAIQDEKLQVVDYELESIPEVLADALHFAMDHQDVRFNFFISPSIGNYLDWISKEKKIPRSVYLRSLIERDMNENEDYNG